MDTAEFLSELQDRFSRDYSDELGWQKAPSPSDFSRWLLDATGSKITSRFNELGALLARRYNAGDYTFQFCDWVINRAESALMQRIPDPSIEYPQIFEEVYRAFDSGEWDHHGRSEQPIIDYTDPSIAAIVARLQSG